MDVAPGSLHVNDFEMHGFMDDANFEQLFDCELINDLLADNQFGSTPGDMSGFSPTDTINSLVQEGDLKDWGGEDYDFEGSSGTATTTTTTPKKTKTDRARTLVSERRRRGRMKEKLYELRSLVPNITKMDKASIIADAVSYVQELQVKDKRLKAEISDLEASLSGSERHHGSSKNLKKGQISSSPVISKKIIQMEMFQLEERGFYVRLVCTQGQGVAASLYRAIESLTTFDVQNSNLATASERFIVTFTLSVKESEQGMNLATLKLWVTGALRNQGFELVSSSLHRPSIPYHHPSLISSTADEMI